MSRVGQKPVEIPSGVTVKVDGSTVAVKGDKGELSFDVPGRIAVAVEDGKVNVSREDDSRDSKSFHGLTRSLIANMLEGVSKGFSKALEIEGVGFKAELNGKTLMLSLGFASAKEFAVPDGIDIQIEKGTKLLVSGADKQQVGDVAAQIRSYFPAEPYKGKGIRYKGERVRRKVGKTVA